MRTIQTDIQTKNLTIETPVTLENGETLEGVQINYTTAGKPNQDHDNVVWVFHALTANSDPFQWWPELFGTGKLFDPAKHYIVCANMLGSCYGTTGPKDHSFPLVTIHDMVKLHKHLRHYLGIKKIGLGIGGSMGGQQLLQWAVEEPTLFDHIVPMATNAVHSPWGIAFNEAQRMALENPDKDKGIETARAIGMLSYRSYAAYHKTQLDEDLRIDDFRASSYQRYQGEKLRKRFTPESYYYLSKAMDSHNLGRYARSTEDALGKIQADSLVVSLSTDLLFPVHEQEFIAAHIPGSRHEIIESQFGHDGFLIEMEALDALIKDFWTKSRLRKAV